MFLREQQNLIIEMNNNFPKNNNRWMHLGKVLNFYKVYLPKLVKYAEDNRPDQLPLEDWWKITLAIPPAMDAIKTSLVLLKNRLVLISQQM